MVTSIRYTDIHRDFIRKGAKMYYLIKILRGVYRLLFAVKSVDDDETG